jgi:hypothetical protein
MMPFTAFLPVATLLGSVIQLRESTRPDPTPPEDGQGAIEAEYSARWDEE